LYNDIRNYVEEAFYFDFNLVIEEFEFYHQMTPKMQTDLIKSTRVFREFEKAFNHFFDECERGFTNELIINMYCRINTPGKPVIPYKSNVKEMYFIRQGVVEVFNPEFDNPKREPTTDTRHDKHDRVYEEQAILYLPKFSYFGDY
jgi:signal-transduction protein with cAMP-binding, CBS, and nucleotidyltransferase domain